MSVGLIIAMPLRQWGLIDASVDDDAGVETVDGNRRRADLAHSIRRAGWDQIAHWTPGVPGSGSWPPPDEIVKPRLTIAQWLLTVDALERWAAAAARTGRHETAARERELRALILSRLQAHGVRLPEDSAGNSSQDNLDLRSHGFTQGKAIPRPGTANFDDATTRIRHPSN
ncbi:hypothetical protein HD597_003792 [Nonomuraea thailandensis]|uniref:Uncharacterized protein n=1 Tax=Nonomuraea thailandensis TaxID=1188745 RepID=A0A9X2GFL8_9ACTN|nr:hypothetical protein [Nonomuraea thailandensis]MCP2356772.1 hypothetical protein [Nonomuraea thailandensis]